MNTTHVCIFFFPAQVLSVNIFLGGSYLSKCRSTPNKSQMKFKETFPQQPESITGKNQDTEDTWGGGDSRFRQLKAWGFSQTYQLEPGTTNLVAISEATTKGHFGKQRLQWLLLH